MRKSPLAVSQQQGRFFLGACNRDSEVVVIDTPTHGIQGCRTTQYLGDLGVAQGLGLQRGGAGRARTVREDLEGADTVPADFREQLERAGRPVLNRLASRFRMSLLSGSRFSK